MANTAIACVMINNDIMRLGLLKALLICTDMLPRGKVQEKPQFVCLILAVNLLMQRLKLETCTEELIIDWVFNYSYKPPYILIR